MFNIVGRRKIWYLISLLIIIPGLISLLFVNKLNFGIDFTGGVLLHLKFEQNVQTGEVHNVLGDFTTKDISVQKTEDSEILVRLSVEDSDKIEQMLEVLDDRFTSVEVLRDETVGPVIGKELTRNALFALLLAAVAMIIYITIRFEFRFAIAAIIALTHDVLVTLALVSLFNIEVSGSFVAAILTIIGYSINNTIVIFDRIRENLKYTKKKFSLEELINESIWQSMSRSINTSLTVIFVLVAMLLFGGVTTKTLILILLIGVISGFYSSVFAASEIWFELQPRKAKTA